MCCRTCIRMCCILLTALHVETNPKEKLTQSLIRAQRPTFPYAAGTWDSSDISGPRVCVFAARTVHRTQRISTSSFSVFLCAALFCSKRDGGGGGGGGGGGVDGPSPAPHLMLDTHSLTDWLCIIYYCLCSSSCFGSLPLHGLSVFLVSWKEIFYSFL